MTTDEEFSFQIDAYTPDTMPMARLAEYIAQLAAILGEEKAVHFVKLKPGSTQVIHRIEREAVPKVRERTSAVRRGAGPGEARRAYRRVNRLLREDNGTATLRDDSTGAEIIKFPGIDEKEETFSGVRQRGAVDGEVIRIGGVQKWIPITLRSEQDTIANCFCRVEVAKQLAKHLFEPVRLFGNGRWCRDTEGKWALEFFSVDSFDALREETISQAIARIAAIETQWGEDSLPELYTLRHNGEMGNGGL
jgi:hypothetical protein